jgi:tRNA threonylcarbamoyl adenosine modification protein (Sua5/YciO/YrdC/YwlC family)
VSTVAEALAALARGAPVVMPTDTVYGVAAPLTDEGTAALFRVKTRPRTKAIPVLGAGVDDLSGVARFSGPARVLARRFWPGPLTLVLPRVGGFAVDLGGTETSTVAVRVPDHPVALELLAGAGPLAVTSANRSGEPPASTAREARDALGAGPAVYLDGGRVGGEPSIVVSLAGGFAIVRPGALSPTAVEAALSAPTGD